MEINWYPGDTPQQYHCPHCNLWYNDIRKHLESPGILEELITYIMGWYGRDVPEHEHISVGMENQDNAFSRARYIGPEDLCPECHPIVTGEYALGTTYSKKATRGK